MKKQSVGIIMQMRRVARMAVVLVSLALAGMVEPVLADPPGRVMRLSYIRGDVSFTPAGEEQWAQASLNRPVITGDRLWTDRNSRAELEVGAATVRLDDRTGFSLLNLDDNIAQIELSEGTLNLHVHRIFGAQTYEIDTPTLAFTITKPGEYRIDIAPQGDSTMVTVFEGSGKVYGESGANYRVRAQHAYRFYDSQLRDYEVLDIPPPDDFDTWCFARDDRYERSTSRRYVSEEVIGYSDLDDYGRWESASSYGHVWFPTSVAVGWAPYRTGHWVWVDPWGWTWVDEAPWGFAPFHYGRWVYVSQRWGWVPGPVAVRAVYAPALVVFAGGAGWSANMTSGGPVCWYPLAPREVYVPWYRTSRNYFTSVNVSNTTVVNNTYITNVYNNYSTGTPINNVNYAYRTNTAAVTAVPGEVFVSARSVSTAQVKVDSATLNRTVVASRFAVAPTSASLVASTTKTAAAPPASTFNRAVIARTAPPPQPVSFAVRKTAIEKNGGQALSTIQMRAISTQPATASNPSTAARQVRVVAPTATTSQSPSTGQTSVTPSSGTPTTSSTAPTTSTTATTQSSENVTTQSPQTSAAGSSSPTQRMGTPANPSALPSSRYAQPASAAPSTSTRSSTAPTTTTSTTATNQSASTQSTQTPTAVSSPPSSTQRAVAPANPNTLPSSRYTQPSTTTSGASTTTRKSAESGVTTSDSHQQNSRSYTPSPASSRSSTSPPQDYNRSSAAPPQEYMKPAMPPAGSSSRTSTRSTEEHTRTMESTQGISVPQSVTHPSPAPTERSYSAPSPPPQQRTYVPTEQRTYSAPPAQRASPPPPQQYMSSPPQEYKSPAAPPPQQQIQQQPRYAPPPTRTPPPTETQKHAEQKNDER